MYQFEILYTEYDQNGSLSNRKHYLHPQNAEEMKQKYEELNSVYRTYVDEQEQEHRYKAYKVECRLAVYKTLTAEEREQFFDLLG